MEGIGPLDPAVFVFLLVAQAVLAPLPTPAWAFDGLPLRDLLGLRPNLLGRLLGGILCFAITRFLGRKYVARSTRLQGLYRRAGEHGGVIVFVLRLIPVHYTN